MSGSARRVPTRSKSQPCQASARRGGFCAAIQASIAARVGKGQGPSRRRLSSRSRVWRRWSTRSPPAWASGCLSRMASGSASTARARMSALCSRSRPTALWFRGLPAESSGTMPQRSRCAATSRDSVRSGVMSAARRPSSSAARNPVAMAMASAPGEGARSRVMPAQAPSMSSRSGPSARQASVMGAGRRASETSALRAGAAGGMSLQRGTSARVRPRSRISAAWRYCGWSCCPGPSPAVSPSQAAPGMSPSTPGRTTAPCGRSSTAPMSARVGARDAVEPATITGSSGGVVAQRSSRRSRVSACAPAGVRVPSASIQPVAMSRNRSVFCQCSESDPVSIRRRASGSMPSSCISASSAVRLLARSKAAEAGARSGAARRSFATRRVSCRRNSKGSIPGRAASPGGRSGARSVTRPIRGSSVAPSATSAASTRRAMRVVFTRSVTRAIASGG